jgi:glycosyltransferase involved in cell wall biosynthesis
MKIVFVSSSLERGGLEQEVEATARLALRGAHDVTLFTPYKIRDDSALRRNLQRIIPVDSGQEQWRKSLYGWTMVQLAKAKLFMRNWRTPSAPEEVGLARRFVPALADSRFWDEHARRILEGCDLLHLFGKPKPFLARAASHARSVGLKVIYEEASQVTAEYARRTDHRAFASSSALCDVIIARCDRHVANIRQHYHYPGATRVIEQWAYGTEDDLLAIDRPVRASASDPFVFGSIGRLDGGKGMDTILKAFAIARQRQPQARLRIAGQGEHEQQLRRLTAEMGIASATDFVGYVEGRDKIAFYAAIDAFLIASLNEGGPITGVEAMAAALPIISTPVGAMPERLAEGSEALFFETENIDALAERMVRLMSEAELPARLGRAARRRYQIRNHSTVCASQKIALWDELGKRPS